MQIWERVPTGATAFYSSYAEMKTANGSTYVINRLTSPIWHSSDMRLAVHKLEGSNDYLIEKIEGGVMVFGTRVGHTVFVMRAPEGTPEWYYAMGLMGRQVSQ